MTPTLFGRWQTRLFLLATAGIFATIPFAFGWIGSQPSAIFFWLLGYIAIFGLGWDVFYIYLQQFRWDRDWPGVFQLFAGIWEAIFLIVLVKTVSLPGIPQENFDLLLFVAHYSFVWLTIYLASQSLMRIFFPYWRFRGGQWF